MAQVYHLQKAHPNAGESRIWSLLAAPDISVRTVGRIMALDKLVYDDIPHVPKREEESSGEPNNFDEQQRAPWWIGSPGGPSRWAIMFASNRSRLPRHKLFSR